ncbi:MAG: hypothetical protein JXP34_20475, partial [Planctomycetes bacterium]|nr:hypothetical protein [Planctomycetota bacterium]
EPLRATDWKGLKPGPGVAVGREGGLSWRDDAPAPAGFAVRDVAAGSGFVRPAFRGADPKAGDALTGMGLALRYEAKPRGPRAIDIRIEVEDRTGKDRAVTLLFAIPVDAATWWDDATTKRAVRPLELYQFVASAGAGATGTASYYPLGCVRAGDAGIALGHPMDAPRIIRYAYDAAWKLLYAAIDVGLAPERPRADARLVAFSFDPRWGFRAAWEAYRDLHPHLFEKRVPKEGLWMAFHAISRVRGFEDFGFAFKEGTNEVPFDDAHDILSFRYTEPQSHWQKMPKDADRSHAGCVEFLERRAREGDAASRAAIASAVRDADGRYILDVLDTPWCDGCVFTLSPNPHLPGETTKAKLNYTIEQADARYAKTRGGEGIDGEYLDSLEGWSLACDFDRSRFGAAETPLVFDTRSRRPCVLNIFNIYEFARFVAEDLHRRGKLLMANSTPIRFGFLMPLLDLAGIEINWKRGGRYAPDPEWWMNYRRALSGTKPYLFLMNTDFANWTAEDTERYMRRSLHYAIHPSFFSANASTGHYFSQPALYDRDRPLFRRYAPWIRRLGEAGWEPIPHARAGHGSLRIERYGPDARGRAHWTFLNPAGEAVEDEVAIDLAAIGLAGEGGRVGIRRPLSEETIREEPAAAILRVRIRVAPGDTELVAIEPAR